MENEMKELKEKVENIDLDKTSADEMADICNDISSGIREAKDRSLLELTTKDDKSLSEIMKKIWEEIKKLLHSLKETAEKMFGKGACYEAIKNMEKHIDELQKQCEETNEISLQTVSDMYKLTKELAGNFSDLEAGKITPEQLEKATLELASKMNFKKETFQSVMSEEVKNILSDIDANNADILIYSKDEISSKNVVVFDKSNNKAYMFSVTQSTNQEGNQTDYKISLTREKYMEENDYEKIYNNPDFVLVPNNLRSDDFIKDVQYNILYHSGIEQLTNKLENMNKTSLKLKEIKNIKKYVERANEVRHDEQHNIVTFLDKKTGVFKAFYPEKNKLVELVKSKDRLVGTMYNIEGLNTMSDEQLKELSTDGLNGSKVANFRNATLDNGEAINANVAFDNDNVVRRVFENENTKEFLDNICNIDNETLNEVLMIEDIDNFKAITVDEKFDDKIFAINREIQKQIGDSYNIRLLNDKKGTYIRATPVGKDNKRDVFITFKENGEPDKYAVRTDDNKIKTVIREDNVKIREAHAKEDNFNTVVEAFRKAKSKVEELSKAEKATERKDIKKDNIKKPKQVGRE